MDHGAWDAVVLDVACEDVVDGLQNRLLAFVLGE
jgi:hypothetical protein